MEEENFNFRLRIRGADHLDAFDLFKYIANLSAFSMNPESGEELSLEPRRGNLNGQRGTHEPWNSASQRTYL